jgi:Family of unknown function (DUF5329)
MKLIISSFILACLSSVQLYAANADDYKVETNHLKSYIIESSCVFMRNGIAYKGSEAITHINRKEEYFKNAIKSTEDFIRLAATKSEMSGKNYTVSCVEGKTENLGDWLSHELASFRKNNNSSK